MRAASEHWKGTEKLRGSARLGSGSSEAPATGFPNAVLAPGRCAPPDPALSPGAVAPPTSSPNSVRLRFVKEIQEHPRARPFRPRLSRGPGFV
eukprot:3013962-Alexandrium_andersonii.AAC.1